MNSFRFLEQRHQRGDRAPGRAARGGRARRAGDAALRPAHGRSQLAALQGGGARLPLLPRARPRPGRAAPRMLAAARAALPELPAARAARYERDWGCRPTTRGCWPTSRAGATASSARVDGAATPRGRATGSTELRARHRRRRRAGGLAASAPAALAALVGLVAGAARRAGAARKVLDVLVAEGGEPDAIVEREGLGAMGDGDELAGVVGAAIADNAGRRRARSAAATPRRWARSSAP